MDIEFDIPIIGVRENKIEDFKDLITRYLVDNDQYNNKAIFNGVYPALQAIDKKRSLSEVFKSIDAKLSGFQFNWIINTLGEHAHRGVEIKEIWDRYQKGMEPKKKTRRNKMPELILDE